MSTDHFALLEVDQISAIARMAKTCGILEEIGRGSEAAKHATPKSAQTVAAHLRLHAKATRLLLEALVAIGYLEKSGRYFGLSAAYRELLSDSSYNWNHLEEFLRTGKPWIEIDESTATIDKFYEQFFSSIDYQGEISPFADAVAVKLGGMPEHILDIGAGTGAWSLAMAKRCVKTRVTAVDLPRVLSAHFLRYARAVHCAHRVDVITGDFHEVEFPGEMYDRVVLGQSFHFLRRDVGCLVLARIAGALKAEGELVIIDHFANETTAQALSRRLYEMRLAMRTARAVNYSKGAIEAMCSSVGFVASDYFRVEGPGFLAVLVFKKKDTRS